MPRRDYIADKGITDLSFFIYHDIKRTSILLILLLY